MTKAQLDGLVNSIQKPKLKNSEVMNLLNREDLSFVPMDRNQVVQSKPPMVAQSKPQQVVQAVAQTSWVAQSRPQQVAQSKPPIVAQIKPQQVVENKSTTLYTQADKDIEKLKEQIYQIQTIEGRKKFVIDVGFGIASEKRGGKAIYLYGIKKIDGKKYRLYIGNATKL